MNRYLTHVRLDKIPRLPLEGSLDLTYRCNNNCRHCWLRIPPESADIKNELTFNEIKGIVEDARSMGCQKWLISGGEPMLRSDFVEIFDYITSKSVNYSLNTNGTLITPEIAELMKRKGRNMVALYGATPEVHDHITRNPGSFRATIEGISLLNDTGTRFTVQIIPMRENYFQFQEMVQLAKSISQDWRIGASWLYLSANGLHAKNTEIAAQRLPPDEVLTLDKPDISCKYSVRDDHSDNRLFARCIHHRNAFHIDPYGQMTFCCFIKDPVLRYDLKRGDFHSAWEEFIPSITEKIRGGDEFSDNCGSCELRAFCRWCPVYAYLEHGRYEARIEYLCELAKKTRDFIERWKHDHCRYYQIAGITVKVDSDLPFRDTTFKPKFRKFRVDSPGKDIITVRYHFTLPELKNLGEEIYRKSPWLIYRKGQSWIYIPISAYEEHPRMDLIAVFNDDYTNAHIYTNKPEIFLNGQLNSLTLLTTDQIILVNVLADRKACILHSAGMILHGKGILFLGHSEAGKSTIVKMLGEKGEILCDDRNIVRQWPDGFRVHGTWSHGEVPLVSSGNAPLNAILFLRKSEKNCLTLIDDRKKIIHMLMGCLVRSYVTADWWNQMISLLEDIAENTPCYHMEFDKSGKIVRELEKLLENIGDR